jgi:hypothetical protein
MNPDVAKKNAARTLPPASVTKPQHFAAINTAPPFRDRNAATRMRAVLLPILLLGLAAGGTPVVAAQFAAALVTSGADGRVEAPPGKIYVADGRVRIDTPQANGGFFLVDGAAGAAYLVLPAQRIYMDVKQSSPLTRIFIPLGPGDACRQWQAMARISGTADQGCRRLGPDAVKGRDSVKYEALSPQGRRSYRWVDAALNFVTRLEEADGETVAVADIQEGPPPTSLFMLPGDYRKFDPQQLIDRIKHSDVWVEPQ